VSATDRPRGKGFRLPAAPTTEEGARLDAVLGRLEELVDWERRARSDGSGRLMKVTVDPARDLLERLGSPHSKLRCVHIAGTKAKGSVASIVAAGLRRAGHECGLFTSPHVERVTERVALGGRPIGDSALASALEDALAAREAAILEGGPAADATWFDVMTAAAALAFARAGATWGVFECGLGGRLDSTNALHGEVCVVTNVDLEHTAILGSTRAAIAAEKVGILKAGSTLVTGLDPEDEAGVVAAAAARELGCAVIWVRVGRGSLETRNAALARAVFEALGARGVTSTGGQALAGSIVDDELLAEARLPARMEVIPWRGRTVVLDGAHVPSSLAAVLEELEGREELSGRPFAIFGCGADKDAGGLLKVLSGRVDSLLCVSTGTGPHAPPAELAKRAMECGVKAETAESPEAALEQAAQEVALGGWILVTGSIHLAGNLRRSLRSIDPPLSC